MSPVLMLLIYQFQNDLFFLYCPSVWWQAGELIPVDIFGKVVLSMMIAESLERLISPVEI